MQVLKIETVRNFLHLDDNSEDEILKLYQDAAVEYVRSACGQNVDLSAGRTQLIILMLIADYYENRAVGGVGAYNHSIKSMLIQLQLENEVKL